MDSHLAGLFKGRLISFGVNSNEAPAILANSAAMNSAEAITTIAMMSTEQKQYATGYLAAIMVADGEIADSEVKLWQLICTLASCPTMSMHEALDFWRSH